MDGQTRQDRTVMPQNAPRMVLYRTHLQWWHRLLRNIIIHHPPRLPSTQSLAILDLHQHTAIREGYFIVGYHLSITFRIYRTAYRPSQCPFNIGEIVQARCARCHMFHPLCEAIMCHHRNIRCDRHQCVSMGTDLTAHLRRQRTHSQYRPPHNRRGPRIPSMAVHLQGRGPLPRLHHPDLRWEHIPSMAVHLNGR